MMMNCWPSSVVRPARSTGMSSSRISSSGSLPAVPSPFRSRRAKSQSSMTAGDDQPEDGRHPSGVNGAAALGPIQPHWLERRMPKTANPNPAAEKNAPAGRVWSRPAVAGMARRKSISSSTTDRLRSKDKTPGVIGRDPAADQRTERRRRAADTAEDAIGQRALATGVGDRRERGDGRDHQNGAEAFDERPADQQHPRVWAKAPWSASRRHR
jgi:hypothetical protein